MENDNKDEFQIFVENNIKDLKEIIKLPNDNYTCTECELIPEIKEVDYSSGEIEYNCRVHGNKKIPLKNYLLEMSKNTYFHKKCSFCRKIQNKSPDFIFDYCLFCKKIICQDCQQKHTHIQILKLNDLDNKCLIHHNKFFTCYCFKCKENYCDSCKKHTEDEHGEQASSYEFMPSKEIDILKKCNILFKKEMKILPYLIKINDLIITSQSKYSFNYFHNMNLRVVSNSFLKTDLFLNEINEYKEKLKLNKSIYSSFLHPVAQAQKVIKNLKEDIEKQKKLLEEFNEKYKTNLDGNEISINLNDKNIDDSGFELLAKIKFARVEKIKMRRNFITKIEPLKKICNKKTKKVDLSFNKIVGLNDLNDKNNNLNGLEEFYLNNNEIEDISVFKMDDLFPELKILNVSNNRINFELEDTQKLLKELKKKLIIFKYQNYDNYYLVTNFSSVLTEKEFIDYLNERFKKRNPNIKNIIYNLIYRGTRDGDRASDFHKKVDPISKTLCVVKSPKAIFGGYTEATWDGDNLDKYDENAFCFRLTDKMKIYELVEGKDAIGCNPKYGPIFRYTFHLEDNYFSKKAFCYGGYSHFHSGTKHSLTGGEKFPEVNECEVFQIIFE